jgi:ubiquinone/menaquinone biosynthesis C-methylase UbiE
LSATPAASWVLDFSAPMLELAREDGRAGRDRLPQGNALELPFEDAASTRPRRLRDPQRGGPAARDRRDARVVRPGGRVVVLEITTRTAAA